LPISDGSTLASAAANLIVSRTVRYGRCVST
jgi:hypothetical protein